MDTKKEDAIRQLKLLVGSLSSMQRVRVVTAVIFYSRPI